MPLGREVDLGPGDIVLDGDWRPSSPTESIDENVPRKNKSVNK